MREVNHLLVHDQAGLDGWDNLSALFGSDCWADLPTSFGLDSWDSLSAFFGFNCWDNLSNVCLVWMVGIICLKFVWFEWLG
jgi:hypothetical protein